MAARETAAQKALRLIADGRVRFTCVTPDACAAVVEGDTLDAYGERPRYDTRLAGRWECSCAHGVSSRGLCSHAMAARLIYGAIRPALEERRL